MWSQLAVAGQCSRIRDKKTAGPASFGSSDDVIFDLSAPRMPFACDPCWHYNEVMLVVE